MGDIRLKSDKETVLGKSRLQGREKGVGEVEVGEPEEEENEEEKGQGKSRGLFGPEQKLLLDWVSESSSDMALVLQFSSS